MRNSILCLSIIISVCNFNAQKPHKNIDENLFQRKLTLLNNSYKDSQNVQHGGITEEFAKKWGDRYWQLIKENPDNSLAPAVASKAFSLYSMLKNPNLEQQKLSELSIDDRAMSSILPYWNSVLWNGKEHTLAEHPYIQKLKTIASNSQSREMQIAAHFYLAKWFTQFKYYKKAYNQLNILDITYEIYVTNPRYGNDVKKMRQEADDYSAGKTMPEFNAKMLDGSTLTANDLQHKVTFLYFYASTCGACISMYPKITRLYKKYKSNGFKVVGVGFDWSDNTFNSKQDFEKFAKKYHITWPQSTDFKLWKKLHVFAYSTGYLIDQNGKIVRISRSDAVSDATDEFEDTSLEEAVTKLLGK